MIHLMIHLRGFLSLSCLVLSFLQECNLLLRLLKPYLGGGLNPAISDTFSKRLETYEEILVKTSLTPLKKAEVS